MSLGLVGRKVGMTRILPMTARPSPVTVLDVSNNRVTQIKRLKPTAMPPFRSPLASATFAASANRCQAIWQKQVSKLVTS